MELNMNMTVKVVAADSRVKANAGKRALQSQVRYKKEVNGDHSLAVIYPGCYIAQSVAFDYYESNDTTVYRVERIGMRDGWCLADCRKVLRINPQMSKLTEEEEKRLERLLKISNQVAIAPNLARLKEGWV